VTTMVAQQSFKILLELVTEGSHQISSVQVLVKDMLTSVACSAAIQHYSVLLCSLHATMNMVPSHEQMTLMRWFFLMSKSNIFTNQSQSHKQVGGLNNHYEYSNNQCEIQCSTPLCLNHC